MAVTTWIGDRGNVMTGEKLLRYVREVDKSSRRANSVWAVQARSAAARCGR
jgi:hypothetical protein